MWKDFLPAAGCLGHTLGTCPRAMAITGPEPSPSCLGRNVDHATVFVSDRTATTASRAHGQDPQLLPLAPRQLCSQHGSAWQSHQILVRLKCKVEEIAYFLGRIAPVFMSVLCASYHPPLFAPPPLGVVVGMVQGAPGDAGDEAQAVQGQRGSSSARCSSPLLPPNNGTRLTPLGSPCLAPAPAPAPAHPALSPVPGEQTLT